MINPSNPIVHDTDPTDTAALRAGYQAAIAAHEERLATATRNGWREASDYAYTLGILRTRLAVLGAA